MRVRAHIDPLPGQKFRRTHLIEKDEGPDHLALHRRQRPAHLEPAQIPGARHNDGFDGIHGIADRDSWIKKRVPAHGGLLLLLKR